MYKFNEVPLDDNKTYELFAKGDTLGVFQLERQLGQDWSKRIKPKDITSISDLIALIRPGALESGQSELYAKRCNYEEPIEYLHPALESVLKDTYGCLCYQEQAIRIAMDIAGFTDIKADMLRKCIGKKDPVLMAEMKQEFLEGCEKNGVVTKEQADEIFSWIEKGQRYSFNKSHGLFYALNAYHSAYAKVNYPTEFYTAYLTYSKYKPSPREEIYNLVQNAKRNNVEVYPPDIRKKNVDFDMIGDRKVIFGLSHIRGIGEANINKLKNVNVNSFIDLIANSKKLNKGVIEALIKSGACDCYELSRNYMVRCLYAVLGQDNSTETPLDLRSLSSKELQFFYDNIKNIGDIENVLNKIIENNICINKRKNIIKNKINYIVNAPEDTSKIKSIWEKLYLGLNISCSAADDYNNKPGTISCKTVYSIEYQTRFTINVVIDKIYKKKTSEKSKIPNSPYCYLDVSDNSCNLSRVICWPELYNNVKEQIYEGCVANIRAYKNKWNNRDQIIVNNLEVI
ncbi:MAG: hypothetical protein BAJALOKI3v1_50102 [Promethearchaeota archaeon]|nr:MAG: hypothetical protein BAJALOKI3v1_50102 [Candidatus Lokiarchaeota archaeon]